MRNYESNDIVKNANFYILPQTLESYLEKDLLLEYLRALDADSLEYALDYIESDDIVDLRENILSLIQTELKNRLVKPGQPYTGKYVRTTKKTLTIFLANHKLTEYLQTLSDYELECAERDLYIDDIKGDAVEILAAIRIEKEYRSQEETIEKNKSSLNI